MPARWSVSLPWSTSDLSWFRLNQTEIHILPAGGLMAVNGDPIFAGLKSGPPLRREFGSFVSCQKASGLERQHAIGVNFDVFVMVHPGLKILALVCRQLDLAAQPNVCAIPGGADHCSRSVACAEAAGSFLPVGAMEGILI